MNSDLDKRGEKLAWEMGPSRLNVDMEFQPEGQPPKIHDRLPSTVS